MTQITKSRSLTRSQTVRLCMGAASVLLLGTEVLIGLFAHGWIRDYIGDVLVVILLYTLWRTVLPEKPRYGWILPAGLLFFAFGVELLQLWGFCDRFHITNKFLRICIGTGYSNYDLLSYAVGILPCFVCEFLLRRKAK